MKWINSVLEFFTYDLGIDLGTANTIVYMRNHGIVVSEPSVVAIDKRTKMVLAVGKDARQMIGRTPANISAVRPLRGGVISDFDTTQAMIHHFIHRAHGYFGKSFKIPRPRVIIGVPTSVTEVERQAVLDAAKTAGAREVFIVEEAMAAAIGAGLPVEDASGSMIVDIGGGTSDIAVFSLGGIVVDKTIRIAGDEMDEEIVNFARSKYNLLIGQRMAEEIKISIGSASPLKKEKEFTMRGRDLLSGLPKSIKITSVEIREALIKPLEQILEAIHDAIETSPPELIPDLLDRGITIAGGGAMLNGIDKFLAQKLKTPVIIAEDSISCVARGAEKVLEDIELLSKIKFGKEDWI